MIDEEYEQWVEQNDFNIRDEEKHFHEGCIYESRKVVDLAKMIEEYVQEKCADNASGERLKEINFGLIHQEAIDSVHAYISDRKYYTERLAKSLSNILASWASPFDLAERFTREDWGNPLLFKLAYQLYFANWWKSLDGDKKCNYFRDFDTICPSSLRRESSILI